MNFWLTQVERQYTEHKIILRSTRLIVFKYMRANLCPTIRPMKNYSTISILFLTQPSMIDRRYTETDATSIVEESEVIKIFVILLSTFI